MFLHFILSHLSAARMQMSQDMLQITLYKSLKLTRTTFTPVL